MIRVNHNEVEIEGNGIELVAEFALIARALCYKNNIISKDEMKKIAELAFMSPEEMADENKQARERITKKLDEMIDRIKKVNEKLDALSDIDDLDEEDSKDPVKDLLDTLNKAIADLEEGDDE